MSPNRPGHSVRRYLLSVLAALLLLIHGLPARAGPTQLKPYLSVHGETSDNILYSENNETSDLISIVTGGISSEKKTERLNYKLDLKLRQHLYKAHDELDTLDKSSGVNFNYRVTERLSMSGSGQWKKDALRGDSLPDTGILVLGDRDYLDISTAAGYTMTEVSQLNGSVSYNRRDIERRTNTESSRTVQLQTGYSHDLSRLWRNTIGFASMSFMRYRSDVLTPGTVPLVIDTRTTYDSDLYQLTFGVSRSLSELWRLSVHSGLGYTKSEQRSVQKTTIGTYSSIRDSDYLGNIFTAGIDYDGLYLDAGLSFSHDLKAGAGTNGTVRRTSVSLDITGKVTSEFRWSLKTTGFLNQNNSTGNSDIDELAFSLKPALRYEFDDNLFLSVGYTHTSVEDRKEKTGRKQNILFFEVAKTFIYDLD